MFKGIKTMIIAAMVAVGLGLSFNPMVANADELPETEIVETLPEVPEVEETLPEETPVEEDKTEDKTDAEKFASTFEEFLQWTEMEAEKYGHGESYKNALKAIKTAATTKQVTISTVCSIALAVLILAYIVRSKIKDKSYKKAMIDFANQLNSLINGANAIVDETNAQIKVETKTQAKVEHLEKQVLTSNHGMKDFLTAFLRFTDGVKLGDNKKNEVQTYCISAIKYFDEVTANENNKK